MRRTMVMGNSISLKGRRFAADLLRLVGLARSLNLPVDASAVMDACSSVKGCDQYKILEAGVDRVYKRPQVHPKGNMSFFDHNVNAQVDPVTLLDLRNACIHGHQGGQIVNSEGKFLWDSGRENWLYFGTFFMLSRLRLPKPIELKGTVALLAHPYAYGNFSHWVFDVLPRIDVLRRTVNFDEVDFILISMTGRRYEWETLADLGIKKEKVIQLKPSDYYRTERLVVPSHSRYNNISHQSSALRYLRDSYLTVPIPNLSKKRRLFISRADADCRRLLQENELFEKLADVGFERIELAGVSLRETAKLFQQAEIVAGPFGSGLMNIAFCAPGTHLVEIAAPEFYNCHHWYLAQECELVHHVYFGNSGIVDPTSIGHGYGVDINVDVIECLDLIKSVCVSVEDSG